MNYSLSPKGGWFYAGGTISWSNVFENTGTVLARIIMITVDVDFYYNNLADPFQGVTHYDSLTLWGTDTPNQTDPARLYVAPGSTVEQELSMQIDGGTAMSTYKAIAYAKIECYDQRSGSWITPSFSPLGTSSTLSVSTSPGVLALVIGTLSAIIASAIVILKRRKPQPTTNISSLGIPSQVGVENVGGRILLADQKLELNFVS